MFSSKNAIAHTDLEFRADIQDVSHCQIDHVEPVHIQKTCINRSVRASLTALALLCGAEIFAIQLA